jgi:hypothetical protein
MSVPKSLGHGMLLQVADFNSAERAIQTHERSWRELKRVLEAMPLHLKSFDQAGIQGSPIFDPVGTNEHIKAQLLQLG